MDASPSPPAAVTAVENQQITQALAAGRSPWVEGQLMRLRGRMPMRSASLRPRRPAWHSGGGIDAREQVPGRARSCYDPEIPVDIVELGLVHGCDVEPMTNGFRVR